MGPETEEELENSEAAPGKVPEIEESSSSIMSNLMEPPAFISNKKSYATYKKDLMRWTTLTTLAQEKQANMVVHFIPDDDPIKEKIDTQMEDDKLTSKDGIKNLLEFLAGIYKTDDMGDAYDSYVEFIKLRRKSGVSIKTFISEWENSYHKVKNSDCEMSDMVLAFSLLDTSDLSEMDTKLVLTGVNYSEGKEKKTLLSQMKDALKKFVGRTVISSNEGETKAVKVEESTFITTDNLERVLMMQGWKKPKGGGGGRVRIRSKSQPPDNNSSANTNYRGKKNPLGPDFKPLKCFLCKCEHESKCNCACLYHLANNCPEKKKGTSAAKADLGLFMQANMPKFQAEEAIFLIDSADSSKPNTADEQIVLLSNTLGELCLTPEEEKVSEAFVDCACPTTVAGSRWTKDYIEKLSRSQKEKVRAETSKRVFKFGGGEKRSSKVAVTLPCNLAGRNVGIKTEVVDADIPLLIGNTTLKKANAILYIVEKKMELLGVKIDMEETESGHFSIKINTPHEGTEKERDYEITCLLNTSSEEMTLKEIQKLHHYWGHSHVDKLRVLISNSGRMTDAVKEMLIEVGKDCDSCRVNSNRKPTPVVSIPKALKVNQIVAIDLKEYSSDDMNYILYAIDVFSRFTVGVFIVDKKPETIGEKILEKWVSVLGVMDVLHSDLGGEFINKDLVKLAEYLNVKQTNTAAYSPNMNGCNERNHAVVDRMLEKMLFQDPSLNPEIALCWALNAKNSLENYQGFSPSQIVFGQNPKLPAVYSSGPPGFEEVSMSKAMADHINALHSAREAFIECEADRVLKQALKRRVFACSDDIKAGSWIYFKNKSKRWEGPVKVTTMSGKLLYAVRGGRLLTINSDHAKLVKSKDGEVIFKEAVGVYEKTAEKVSLKTPRFLSSQDGVSIPEPNLGGESEQVMHEVVELEEEVDIEDDQAEETEVTTEETNNVILTDLGEGETEAPSQGRMIDYKQLKPKILIRFRKEGASDWNQARVHSRAGKVSTKKCKGKTNKYENWWNVHDLDSGHMEPLDAERFESIEAMEEENLNGEETTAYAVNVPRYRHGEKKFVEAKLKELDNFDTFDVYEEVADIGQPRLGTNWVCTEKVKDNEAVAKARLTIRGDQEDVEGIRTDSPTVMKGNINILLTVAAMKGWKTKTSDVTAAFLQTKDLERDVFVLPPRERRVPRVLWKLRKPVYGLADASRSFSLNFGGEMEKLGCEKSFLDPAMFLYFGDSDDQNSEYRDPMGMAVTHVDDVLHAGEDVFEETVMENLKRAFKFGSEEELEFRYVGMNFDQYEEGIVVDQDHYIMALESPDMELVKDIKIDEVMGDEGQTEFRSVVAKLTSVGQHSRPDICFEAKALSSRYGKATKQDLKVALKKILKVKSETTKMVFRNPGDFKQWVICGHSDAGIRSMPDKVTSVSGHVIMLCNSMTNISCVLSWKSKKIKRKVASSLAGEALAMIATIGEVVYIKSILSQIFGTRAMEIPVLVVIDAKNLEESINSTSLVDDKWLVPDIATIKEALENLTVTWVRRVASGDMLANCLTKQGAGASDLLEVLHSGEYRLPGGWPTRN